MISLGEEGLELIGNDTESVEAALMNTLVGWTYNYKRDKKNYDKVREFVLNRNARFMDRLPYSEELRPAYIHVVLAYLGFDKDTDKAMKWARILEEKAKQVHDLRALCSVNLDTVPFILRSKGDYSGAVLGFQKGLELCRKIGDSKHEAMCLSHMGLTFLQLGDIQEAAESAYRTLNLSDIIGENYMVSNAFYTIGTALLCQSSWEKSIEYYQRYLEISETIELPLSAIGAYFAIGRTYLKKGDFNQSERYLKEHIEKLILLRGKYDFNLGLNFGIALASLEVLYKNKGAPNEFVEYCNFFRGTAY